MRRLALVALAFVLCTACKVSLAVGVDVNEDGSGVVRASVTLDKEAAERLTRTGGRLAADDLRAAGWKVTGPTTVANGGVTVVATKPFNTPGELPAIIDEVVGERRPLRDFKLTRERSFASTKLRFTGTADLRSGINAFGDDRLKEQTGADIGIDPAELERLAGDRLNRFFSIQVAVRLPGSVDANAPSTAGNGAVWRPELGERAQLTASSSKVDVVRVVALGVAVSAAIAFVGVVIARRRR